MQINVLFLLVDLLRRFDLGWWRCRTSSTQQISLLANQSHYWWGCRTHLHSVFQYKNILFQINDEKINEEFKYERLTHGWTWDGATRAASAKSSTERRRRQAVVAINCAEPAQVLTSALVIVEVTVEIIIVVEVLVLKRFNMLLRKKRRASLLLTAAAAAAAALVFKPWTGARLRISSLGMKSSDE